MTALGPSCTLTTSPQDSSTQLLTEQVLEALGKLGVDDVGFSIPTQGGVYWNGEAMTTTDYDPYPA
jgi:hypothetical protein